MPLSLKRRRDRTPGAPQGVEPLQQRLWRAQAAAADSEAHGFPSQPRPFTAGDIDQTVDQLYALKHSHCAGPARAFSTFAFSYVNLFCMAFLYGRAGCLTAKNGGFRPGQSLATTRS
jgi:hypothetical protein